jgi:predicted branched-subunit amino acid permease
VSIKPKNDAVARTSLSVAFTVGLYGAAFGAAGVTAGFTILQTCLLSILLFSGASQFAVVGIMGAGGSAISAIATATLLGFRNALYGLQMAPILKVTGLKRILSAQITIDESTAVSTLQENDVDRKRGFYLTGIGVYVFWNLFTYLGALGASAIGDPAVWGLDAAVPAAFCGLVWPRLKDKKQFLISALAIVLALSLTPITAAGIPIITTVLLAIIYWVEKMSAIWIAVIGSSITAFLNKYIGHSVPEKWLDRPRFKRINTLVPIVLLSALVGVQTFATKKEIVIDQRFAGVLVALIALKLKASFPIVVASAAITSAAIYNLF